MQELLDMELDLIAKQQEGADTKELQFKLAELKAKAAALSRMPVRGRGRGRFTPVASWHLLSKNNLIDNNFSKCFLVIFSLFFTCLTINSRQNQDCYQNCKQRDNVAFDSCNPISSYYAVPETYVGPPTDAPSGIWL